MASAADTPPPVMGRVDAIGRLVEADPMLADLQTQYAAVADLRFLVVGVWVFTVSLLPAALLLSAGRSKQVALASIAGFVVGTVLMAVLSPVLGVAGGTVGFLVGSVVNLVTVVVLGLRRPAVD